jgi:hypothetical protein
VVEEGISVWDAVDVRGLEAALKPPVGPSQSSDGGPGVKPLEADEFLSKTWSYDNEYLKGFQTGGGGGSRG